MKPGYTYITANKNNTVVYVGMCADLLDRIWKHKQGYYRDAFSKKYNVDKLVYFEKYDDIRDAIRREKQLKGGSRKKKEALVNKMNPDWEDLSLKYKYV